MKIKHLVITRFNLKIWDKDKSNNITLGDDWLEQRFLLFEQFCFPSLLSQTDKKFLWICLFDSKTPTKYLQKIQNFQSILPQLKPIFISELEAVDNYKSITRSTILNEFYPNEDNVFITTRIDNDDSIHVDYIKKINQIAESTNYQDQYCVFEYGYQYFVLTNLLTRIKYPNNHFTSRIEKGIKEKNNIKTVFAIKHSHLRKKSVTESVYVHKIIDKKNPFWIEVIHERNVANDLFLSFRIKDIVNFFQTRAEIRNRTLSEFGLSISISKGNQIKKYATYYLPEVFKKIIRQIIRAIK